MNRLDSFKAPSVVVVLSILSVVSYKRRDQSKTFSSLSFSLPIFLETPDTTDRTRFVEDGKKSVEVGFAQNWRAPSATTHRTEAASIEKSATTRRFLLPIQSEGEAKNHPRATKRTPSPPNSIRYHLAALEGSSDADYTRA